MEYQLLSTATPVAQKRYECNWCRQAIEMGTEYKKIVCIYEGSFSVMKYHLKCVFGT